MLTEGEVREWMQSNADRLEQLRAKSEQCDGTPYDNAKKEVFCCGCLLRAVLKDLGDDEDEISQACFLLGRMSWQSYLLSGEPDAIKHLVKIVNEREAEEERRSSK